MNAESLWSEILKITKSQVSDILYRSILKPTKPLTVKDNSLILLVDNEILKNNFENDGESIRIKVLDALKQLDLEYIDIKAVLSEDEISHIKREQMHISDIEKVRLAQSKNNSNLNPKYTFDTFVIGKNNNLAHAACVNVSENPGKKYNPLFLYGGVGLGKTHLMHAIGHHILEMDKTKNVIYVSSETFTNDLITSIMSSKGTSSGASNSKMKEFRSKYRDVDVLLIDDIQFLYNKEGTQEEFFHTFNDLYGTNKQIVISSDRPPKEIPSIDDRLRSRFEMGLAADIQPPDFETRIAILKKKAQEEDKDFPGDVLEYIANNVKSNIRELEGALTRVLAFATLTSADINLHIAKDALKDILISYKTEEINVYKIKEKVSDTFGIKMEDLDSKKRPRAIAYPRQIAMYLSRELTDLSFPKIGEEFGGRDHTTVIHAYDKISKDIANSESVKIKIEKIISDLNG